MICRWETKHTVINGHRLKFDGTALQLFGNWIKWLLLTIITLGIYGFWVCIKIKKWTTKHTHFEAPIPSHDPVDAPQPTLNQDRSAPLPRPSPQRQESENDWISKISSVLPLVYILWFCGIAVTVFFLLNLFFK